MSESGARLDPVHNDSAHDDSAHDDSAHDDSAHHDSGGLNPGARVILFVHAHPDDETVGTGATLAHYAARSDAHVTVVTCTLGEEGEVRVPQLAQLAADQADQLGGYRYWEYRQATAALGVTDTHFLGGVGRWRDSGMMGLPTNDHPRAFWGADVDTAAADLVSIMRERRPEVLVTYDPNGFYGHPDHIQAHRVAMSGAELAADPAWRPELGAAHEIRKIYWTTLPRSVLADQFDAFAGATDNPFEGVESVEDLPFGAPDEEVDALIAGGPDAAERKRAAMRAYPTQVAPGDWLDVLGEQLGPQSLAEEHYRLVKGERGTADGPNGWESDLLS
ncbi:N-acetyl-1-D-myo-inositol-2-amino-2-deoxy-alpha-D-glucopyranoside deacetylase [Glycomyces buryatensis]|uniref:1D-myo-inositol 2-acetamido-2-deoxy-alpha-D-glucopyranoside deacetylase n=1 Tax=Glycomyces buryatensis TaxID=2570927 RepID=A0A4S8QIL6_9ACTN|nr:N-acetyl-1-D-myo-inositol-2-amino-2-deoxy-alpha-D-glucopyranoside deacetylase [Glycomyces buryatensis]THV43102.1 N-acetyl-1-D-myo-inositol-2-amino-2-deoxy-alpha-D-glucopyranoside deacetylase [Glycomyces buryatensis]